MERRVLFRDRQEATPSDFNDIQLYAEASADHIVVDALERGRRFVGFGVAQATATSVNVAPGRLWFDGRRYYRAEEDGVALDLNGLRPNLLRKIVAIVAWPEDIETRIEPRHYLLDADSMTYAPQAVAMEAARHARLQAVGGVEAVAPAAPVIEASAVVIALVEMDPAGIVSITRNASAELRNLGDVADDVDDLKVADAEMRPQVQTMRSDLARLGADVQRQGNKELLLSAVSDIALLKARLDVPDTYVGYRALTFRDATSSDPMFGGYSARIEEGLRFPFAAAETSEVALLNPNAPGVVVTASGRLFPAFTEIERRVTKGDNGNLNLAEYSNLEARTLTRLSWSRSRIRYGVDYEVSTGSALWLSGTYNERLNGGIRGVFQKDGEAFQVYETGKVDQDGHKIVRLSRFWEDQVASPYWSRLPTEENLLGYAHVETFLNAQDGWVTALGPHMKGKPAVGQLTIGICEVDRDQPNFDRILAMTTVNAADVRLVGDAGGPPKFPIEPTFLEGGRRFGYFLVTQHPFQVGIADGENAATQGATGTYYYGLNGGHWFASPGVHLIWRDWRAAFVKSSVDVDLAPAQLLGGVQGIDILADAIIPGSTDVIWKAQVGGVWRALGEGDASVLDDLNGLVAMRITLVGTPDIMPAIGLTGSRMRVSRMATAMKHITTSKALPGDVTSIIETYRLHDFDPAHHTFTPTVRRGDGTIEAADSVETVAQPDGVTEKRCTFNLGAATNAYRSILDATTDSALRPYSVAELVEVALA